MAEQYESEYNGLDVVAIKIGQHKVHAPEHTTFSDRVPCPKSPECSDIYVVGYPAHYPEATLEPLAKQLKKILASDHERGVPHLPCIVLPRYGR